MHTSDLIFLLFGTRSQSRQWPYMLAALLPALAAVEFIVSVYHIFYWSYALIAFVCLWQIYRPTVAGWAAILVFYSVELVRELADLVGQFRDYGSEDHSAWEGWLTASSCIGLAIFMAAILVAVAWHFPKNRTHAT